MNGFMKRALLCVGFAAGLAVLLMACSRVVMPKGNRRKDGMIYSSAAGIDGEGEGTIDALFLGDSECYYAIVPLLFWQERGYATYVCATPSQKLFETVDWLERACRRQSPKLVVMEADALFNLMSYSECMIVPMQRVLPVLRYHNRWKKLKWSDFYARPVYDGRERDKGYLYDTDTVSAEDDEDYMKDEGQMEHISLLSRLYFKRIVAFCRERDIRLMLISTPSRVMWDAGRHNSVAALAEAYGLEYVDMNQHLDEVGIDWSSDTLDKGYHMNFSGALKVSSYTLRLLDDTGLLVDHRDDDAYKPWNKDLKRARKEGQELVYYPPGGTP